MAGLTERHGVAVRPPRVGEGAALSVLWQQLWELHEGFGGYESSRDESTYPSIARRIDEHARLRAGDAILGPHAHLVATRGGRVVGQVEAWCERLGGDDKTPITCDIRSLVVDPAEQSRGLGTRLISTLEELVLSTFRERQVLFAAEVHAQNPAARFYEHLGFRAVSFSCRLATDHARHATNRAARGRAASSADAAAVAALDTLLAVRRQAGGDRRFDAPAPFDRHIVEVLKEHLAHPGDGDPRELVAVTDQGEILGSATFACARLEPPFVPVERAMLGRFAFADAGLTSPAAAALIETAVTMARARTARHIELTDLDADGSPLYEAARAAGAAPWSSTYVRFAAPPVAAG